MAVDQGLAEAGAVGNGEQVADGAVGFHRVIRRGDFPAGTHAGRWVLDFFQPIVDVGIGLPEVPGGRRVVAEGLAGIAGEFDFGG